MSDINSIIHDIRENTKRDHEIVTSIATLLESSAEAHMLICDLTHNNRDEIHDPHDRITAAVIAGIVIGQHMGAQHGN